MIIANGGSYWPESEKTDRFFVEKLNPNDKILFIPAATTKSQETYFDFFKEKMSHYGLTNVVWTNLYGSWEKDTKDIKMVYLAGGNTFKLMTILRSSGFDHFIKEYYNQLIIVGNSAGSVVLGENILTTNDEDIIGAKDYSGLNLLPYSICPHYSQDKKEHLKELAKKFNLKILGIPEENGIILDRQEEKRIGHIEEIC